MPLTNERTRRERITLRSPKRSLEFIPDAEAHAAVGQFLDVRDVHRQSAAELRAARGRRVRRKGIVRRTRERHRVQEDARPRWALDAVRLLKDRPIAHDAPD